MTYDKSISVTQIQKGRFDSMLGVEQFNIPVGQGVYQTSTQQSNIPVNPNNDMERISIQPDEINGVSSGVPPIEPLVAAQSQVGTQVFMEDILRQNLGNFVVISVSFNNVMQEFRGEIVEVGTNFVSVEDTRLGSRAIVPTLFINYVLVPINRGNSTT